MRFKTAGALLVVSAVLVGGCASTGSTTPDAATTRDVAEMKERILELQEQAAMTEVELDRLQDEIRDLRRQLAGGTTESMSSAATAPPPESVTRRVEPPAVSNTTPVEVEEADLAPEPISAVSAGSATGPNQGAGSAEIAAVPDAGALQPVEPAAQALYDRGYTLYHQGKYLDAEASFQRFLQAYPNTELSDNAQFWIGEARYARSDLQGAMAAFREVIQKYPQGNKVPDSLIKEGDCLDKLGDKDGARDRFEEVRRRFPDTGAAVMAEDRLSKLDG